LLIKIAKELVKKRRKRGIAEGKRVMTSWWEDARERNCTGSGRSGKENAEKKEARTPVSTGTQENQGSKSSQQERES